MWRGGGGYVWRLGLWLLLSALPVGAQWVAFNDHFWGTNTAMFATDYNPLSDSGVTNSGYLRDIATGTSVPVMLTTTNRAISSAGSSGVLAAGTPAFNVFSRYIDWGSSADGKQNSIVLQASASSVMAHVFTGLKPLCRYTFQATAVYSQPTGTNRWTLCRIEGASSFKDAHSSNVLTCADTFSGLAANEAAFCTGNNGAANRGDIINWEDIVSPTGIVIIYTQQYTNRVNATGTCANGAWSCGLTALRLEETAPISIVSEPPDANMCLGSAMVLTVKVAGSSPQYQWRKISGGVASDVPGATNRSLALTNISEAAGYFVVISNCLNTITSRIAQVTVAPVPIDLISQPQDQTNLVGSSATFRLVVSEVTSRPVFAQWYSNVAPNACGGTPIAGATSFQFTLSNLTLSNAGYFYALLTNCMGCVTSRVASLAVELVPVRILLQPEDATAAPGGTASFSVSVSGSKPFGYQWYKGGSRLANQTNATLVLSNVQLADSGAYSVVVTNPSSSAVSGKAVLAVDREPCDLVKLYDIYSSGGVGNNAIWRYDQGGTNLGTAWREPGYDDSSWSSGRGGLMVTDSAYYTKYRGTTLSLGALNGTNRVITYYFRTGFVLANDPCEIAMFTTNMFNDAMVVYLNGTEVYRLNMGSGEVAYDTLALGESTAGAVFVTNLPSALLVQGANCIAVEVHQRNNTSPDVVMCLGAAATYPPATLILITNQPSDVLVEESKTAVLSVGNTGFPSYYQWYKWSNGVAVSVPGANRRNFVITNTALGRGDGSYFCVVSNVTGLETSCNAILSIRVDTNGPSALDADGTKEAHSIILSFSEPLSRDTSEPAHLPDNPANYVVTNTLGESLEIVSAVFTNATNVILTTREPRQPGLNYVVKVGGLRDASPRKNLTAPIACPVQTLVTLIGLQDGYAFAQPWPGIDDTAEFATDRWRMPNYDPFQFGTAWYEPGFSLFYVPLGRSCPVAPGSMLTEGLVSAYFRKTLPVEASFANARIYLRYLANHGAAFYFNGTEFLRANLPATPLDCDTKAAGALIMTGLSASTPIPADLIQPLNNLMAAEVHAASVSNRDMAFAMQLTAMVESVVAGPAMIVSPLLDQAVVEGGPATFRVRSVAAVSCLWFSNSVPIAGATNFSYSMPRVPLSADGTRYSCVIQGLSNSVQSGSAVLSVLPDINAPLLLSAFLVGSNMIRATFSEPLNAATATNAGNYAVTNAVGGNSTVVRVVLERQTNILLQVADWRPGQPTLVVSNVRDDSRGGNWIVGNSRVTVGLTNYALLDFSTNTVWRFSQSGVDLGSAWQSADYDDSGISWQTGRSVLDGFSQGSGILAPRATIGGLTVGTILSNIVLRGTNYIITYYFRAPFDMPLVGPGTTLALSHVVDDGAAFYLNSSPCYAIRVNTPARYGDLANTLSWPTVVEGPRPFPANNLVAGRNVLAAEVHQWRTLDPDVTFGAQLLANVPSLALPPGGPTNTPAVEPPLLTITRWAERKLRLSWTNQGPFAVEATDELLPATSPWTPLPNHSNPLIIDATNARRFYRLRY